MRPEDQEQYDLVLKLHGEEAAEAFRLHALESQRQEEIERIKARASGERKAEARGNTSASGCVVPMVPAILLLALLVVMHL